MTVARPLPENYNHKPKRAKVALQLALSFSEKDKVETIQPHDDALVVTLKIGGMTVQWEDGYTNGVKYPSGDRVKELIGSQSTTRQCMVAAVRHQAEGGSSEKKELVKFLKGNLDDFAWNAYKAPGVDPSFICHHLNVNLAVVPRKQPPRQSSKKHSEAIKEEVIKLKQAGAIKEVFYPDWLANTVVVKKKNSKWGYLPKDVTRMFKSQLGKSIEVCVDDMVVKSKVVSEHVGNLGNFFETLRKHKLRLNASKCSFGVRSDKFLGFMVTHRGIEVNPDQVKAINNLQPPHNPKEVQRLTGMTATLNQFISRPEVDEVLFAYIDVACHAVSLVLSYTVVVLTQLSLRSLLRSTNYMGRVAKWGTILGAFDIKYMPRTSMKDQVLADLVAEFVEPSLKEHMKKSDMDEKSIDMIYLKEPLSWKVYVNGAANQRGSGVGLKMGGKVVEMFSDSRLVIGQVEGELEARDLRMQEYLNQIKVGPSWMNPIVLYLKENILLEEKSEADKGNGQAETVNKVIVNRLKKRLDDAKGRWVEELPHVLWTYRTTPRRSIGETLFSMAYGAKAVIPLETSFPTLRTNSFSPSNNTGLLEKSLDLVEARRENAMVQLAYYQHKLKQGYDSNVKLRPLALRDLVLRKVLGTKKNPA
ncbi:uncharacterized protein LOC142628756 [Castanea sativa]|uniref:uncharacterized protein LOC142628756 n=1 Tax=Castanea sativa TaxID=21020 RepID=UPI003F652000